MPTFLYAILSSPWFYVLVVLWLVVDIAAEKRRESLLETLNKLVHKPVIFDADSSSEAVPFYARGLLETFSAWFRDSLPALFKDFVELLKKALVKLVGIITKPDKPLLILGYTLSFILLLIYLYLDAIGVVTALVSKGFVSPDFPEIFQRFEYVAIGGSLFSLLVAGYILSQMTRKHSEISDWDNVTGLWRVLARFIVFVLIATGLFAIVFLALELMIGLGHFENESQFLVALVDFTATVITRLNVALASILLFEDGLKGFVVVTILGIVSLLAPAIVLKYIAVPIGFFVPFVLDLSYRLLLIILFIVWFIITTPILLFTSIFKGLSSGKEE